MELQTPRLERTKEIAYEFLLTNHIKKLPVDIITIASQNYGLIDVGKFPDHPLSFSIHDGAVKKINDIYIILYNSISNTLPRCRWTITHEIGHIELGHLIQFPISTYNKVLDQEADYFASCVLAPPDVLRHYNIATPEQVRGICHLSKEAALIQVRNQYIWSSKRFVPEIIQQFRDFFYESSVCVDCEFLTACQVSNTDCYRNAI